MEGKPLLLHNETPLSGSSGSWIGFTLPPNTWGAVLTIEANGKRWTRQCQPAGSYLSSSDPRVHFGLGSTSDPVQLSIRWPSGKTEIFAGLAAGSYIKLTPKN